MKRKRVIKIGGSTLFSETNEINVEKIKKFCEIIGNNQDFDSLVVICGGGLIARKYISAVREFDGNEALCDLFGIDISRLNSRLMISSFKELAYPIVPHSFQELAQSLLFNKIIIMGGLQPGQSTTSVALEVAEYIEAEELVILTDVDGIYDKDPRKYTDAVLLDKISPKKLHDLILDSSSNKQAAAGEYRIFDAVSLQILKRSDIKVRVMSGIDLKNFQHYWENGKDVKGTIISN